MRATAQSLWALSLLLLPCITAVVVPFDNAGLGIERRNHNTCPRVVLQYHYCDAVTKCCQPGYGCNTCGEGKVGQTCVKRLSDGCRSNDDCKGTERCINDGKQPSFCAQLNPEHMPMPTPKKKKGGKKPKAAMPMAASSLAPSSMIMAPSSMIMAPSSMIMAPSSMVMAPPMMTGKPKALKPAASPKATGKPAAPSKKDAKYTSSSNKVSPPKSTGK